MIEMINKSIVAFVGAEQPIAKDATYYDVDVSHFSLTKGGKTKLLTQNGRCLP